MGEIALLRTAAWYNLEPPLVSNSVVRARAFVASPPVVALKLQTLALALQSSKPGAVPNCTMQLSLREQSPPSGPPGWIGWSKRAKISGVSKEPLMLPPRI